MDPEQKIQSFLEYWGDKIVDPIHHPKIFEFQLKLWKYYNKIEE